MTPSPQDEALGRTHVDGSHHMSQSSLVPKSTSDVTTLTHPVVDQTLRPSSDEIPPHAISVKLGIAIIITFFVVFTALMTARGALHTIPTLVSLFNNMLLAGTIIFGGGPVVIPLLRDYVVEPGWVSSRDFLLGLAIIQTMPGPNFKFAVYLGAMTVARSPSSHSIPSVNGAILASLGIFTPGLWILVGFQSIWRPLRKRGR